MLAAGGALPLRQYAHSVWTQADDLGLSVTALAQDSDGYLWIGTQSGLLRFDGSAFRRWIARTGEQLPSEHITALRSAAAGGLWIGTAAGLSRLAGGRLTNYDARNGLPGGRVTAILEDRTGCVWVGTAGSGGSGLASLQSGSIHQHSTALPHRWVLSLSADSRGGVWIGTARGLCHAQAGAIDSCAPGGPQAEIVALAEDAAGRMVAVDAGRGLLRSSGGTPGPWEPAGPAGMPAAKTLLTDRRGNTWIGTLGQGLFLLRGGPPERFSSRDGLSNDLIEAMLVDREGSVWVGTAGGLDRFKEPKAEEWSTSDGLSGTLSTCVHADSAGRIWVGISGGGINRLEAGRFVQAFGAPRLAKATVLSVHEDGQGRLWAGTTRGLGYFSGDQFSELRQPRGPSLDRVFAMADGPGGELWLADARQGLWTVRSGEARPVPWAAGKGVYELASRRNGELWIGYYEGGVAVVGRDGGIRFHSADSGLAGGAVQAIFEDRNGVVWVSAGSGLSRYRNGRWTTWTAAQGARPAQAIIEDLQGHIWLSAGGVLARLAPGDLDQPADGAPRPLLLSTYGRADGLRLPRTRGMTGPRAARSGDGRLWFTAEGGLAAVDPGQLRGGYAPSAAIERVLVDGEPVDTTGREVTVRGRILQLEYTAIALNSGGPIGFRYRLDGIDRGWNDAGDSRRLVYMNLAPGRHRFRLLASSAEGSWKGKEAAIDIQVVPRFYQSWTFVSLSSAGIVLLGYGAYRLRLQQLNSRFRLVLEERLRLTRELHDTVIQGFAGVVYQLEAAARQFDQAPEACRQKLERALDQADQSLKEARRAMFCMRLPALENSTLAQALASAGEQAAEGTSIRFDLKVAGPYRQLPCQVQAALYIIGREAIVNAAVHARPSRIHVTLAYSPAEVRLVVTDDGLGFDPGAVKAGAEHLGLTGMRERAEQMAASFAIRSEPGRGTTVEVAVPENARDLRPPYSKA